jgi:capsular exopolysaccharide synthesis family protein
MDARRSLTVLRRWLWLLIAATLLAGGAAYLVSSALPRMYESTVTLIVGQTLQTANPDINQLLASQRLSQTYADLVTTGPLLDKVIDREGLDTTAAELRKLVKADAPANNSLVTITVTDPDPVRVASIANTIADELINVSPATAGRDSSVQSFVDADLRAVQAQILETQAEVQRLSGLNTRTPDQDTQLQALQARLESERQTYVTLLGFSSTSGSNLLTVVDPAVAPISPSSPRVLLNTLLAALVGLLLAIGIAFLVEYLDDTLKSPDDVEAAAGLPTLGTIIRMKGDEGRSVIYRLAAILYPRSPVAEAYRTLRTNIEFASVDAPVRVILVTSAIPGEGKTTTAANLAAVFAQAGHATLLVDADLRKPGVHKIFDVPNTTGLTNLLRSDDLAVQDLAQPTEQEHLSVLTTGPLPPNPAELLRSTRMHTVMERLAASADFVIVDSPPLQAVTDAAILSSLVDGTVLVIDAGRTRSGAVRNGRETLAKVGARVLGVTLNRMSESMSGDYYYYDYYGGYGPDAKGKDTKGMDAKGKDSRGDPAAVPKAGAKQA